MFDYLTSPYALMMTFYCIMEVVFAFVMLSLISSHQEITPSFKKHKKLTHVLRISFSAGWIAILFGAMFSAATIVIFKINMIPNIEYIMANNIGGTVSRIGEVVVIPHAIWLANQVIVNFQKRSERA